jgi:PAS domain S-box-containing protein
MADPTTLPDWMSRLNRYVSRLSLAWTIVVLMSFAWNAAQHVAPIAGVPSNLPLLAEIIGHGGIWLIGAIGLRLGSQQIRRQLARRVTIEKALRDSEEKYRILVEQSPASIVITDLKGVIEYVNPKFTQVTGYTAAEAIGQNPRILKSGEMSQAQYKDLWDTVLAGHEWRGELHNRRKNGELYWEAASISPIRDSQGQIVRLLAVKEDITDRRRAEEEVKRIARFPGENPNPVLRLQQDGRVLYVNDAGQVVMHAWGCQVGDYAPAFWRELVAESAATRSVKVVDVQQGASIWSFFVAPIADEGYVNLYAIDITNRKQAEQAERDQRALAEALRDIAADFNSTLEFDAVLDRILMNVGRVVPHDEANIMLISGDDAYVCLSRGKSSGPILTVRLPVQETPHLRQMIETGAPLIVSGIATQASWPDRPESGWIRSSLSAPIRVKDETVGFINLDSATADFFTEAHAARLAIFADQAGTAVHNARLYQQAQTELAERRRIESELQQAKEAAEAASQAKGTFLANMSHELRTPLNAILGFTQLLARDDNLTPDQRDNLATIQRSGQHLLTLINDVLDMSKIEAGRMTLRPADFDLQHMLDGLEELFNLRAADKQLTLLFDLAPGLPRYVHADEGKLRQVIINLLGNAVKFTSSGGVALRAAYQPGRLQVEVEDSGPGLTAEDLALIFKPFVQATNGQKGLEGTGLGLSISYEFVRLMGGELRAISTPGQGSTFAFEVPVTPAEEADVPRALAIRRVIGLEPDQPHYRLLVVDDRAVSRLLLVKLLAPLGFEVREAVNGREALAVWADWQPHLIWMDMRMPVMDGHAATQHIKASPRGPATVIIALTASAFQEERDVILAEGCDGFVRKPFREDEIFERLTRHLGVRFVHADEAQADSAPSQPLTPHRLVTATALPAAWRADLQQATVAADLDRMLALIDQLRAADPALADQLTELARNFNYDQILRLVQPAGVSA